jgi:hypothetical protein
LDLGELLSISCSVLKVLNHEQCCSTFNVSTVEFCCYSYHALKLAMIGMVTDIDQQCLGDSHEYKEIYFFLHLLYLEDLVN